MISHPYAALLSGLKHSGENFIIFSYEDRVLLEAPIFCFVSSYLAGHMGVTITFVFATHHNHIIKPLQK